ncbi:MAG: hypothetical protein VXX33_04695 [Pseudomonadota bacterium]|nr:hypothetical protein [Pseudomonadota bacterium]
MSTLKADTIQSTSGGAATLTKQSAAKVFVKLSGASQTISKSFNISSRSDLAAGRTEITFTSAMDSVHFSKTATADLDPSIGNGLHAYGADGQSSSATPTSTKTRVDVLNYTDSNDGDCGYISITIHGDLA